MSSWAELPAWLVALRAATPLLSWRPTPELLPGRGDWPAVFCLGELALAAGAPAALLLCPVNAPTQLLVALTAAQPPSLWIAAGTSGESLVAALLPYQEVAVPSWLQLPLPQRWFVGHTESPGTSFAALVNRLAVHPAIEPGGWGSAYADDPWPRPLPAALPTAARELLQRRYATQAADLPRSMTFVSRWSRSLIALEDHAGALVLAIAPGRAAASPPPAPEPSATESTACLAPLTSLPADVRWAVLELPTASAAALQASLQQPQSRHPAGRTANAAADARAGVAASAPAGAASSVSADAASSVPADAASSVPADAASSVPADVASSVLADAAADAAASAPAMAPAGDRVTALLGLAAILCGDLQLIEVLRSLAGAATGDWALRAAAIAVAQRQGYLLLLHELYASETDPELHAELHKLTAPAAGPHPIPGAGVLLLPRPGLAPARLDTLLRGWGLQREADARTSRGQKRCWSKRCAHDLQATAARQPAAAEVDCIEDRVLGQRLIYLRGPQAHELAHRCREHFPCWSASAALEQAQQAQTDAARVATLAPLVPLLGDGALSQSAVGAVLGTRLGDPRLVVRRAALLVLAQLGDSDGATLRATLLADPRLDAATRSQLAAQLHPVIELAQPLVAGQSQAAREDAAAEPATLLQEAEAARRGGDLAAASQLLERALELAPLASAAYLLRAQVHAAAGRGWSALIDVTTALALARRQGLRLQAMQELQTTVRAELSAAPPPPTAASELHAVANLKTLLLAGRQREVEEVAELLLLTLPGRAPLWWLAIGLARRDRGRPEQASAALAAALAEEPQLLAARFLLGECRLELGDLEGAGRELVHLDPPVAQRPPRPSLLAAYADELLGRQAAWEAREHAFARVQLLRELGQPAAALAVTTALLGREPEAADALLAHGILLIECGQPAAALGALDRGRSALLPTERLLSEPDPLGTLQLYRALALSSLNEKAPAAAALRQALRLCPERAAEVAAVPQLATLLEPGAPPAAPPGYAVLRRLAREGLAEPEEVAPRPQQVSAAPATLVGAGQPDHVPLAPQGRPRPAAESPAPAARPQPGHLDDAELLWSALRSQAAELLVAALAALDADANADACRALLEHAASGLDAIEQLAPQTFATQAAAVRAFVAATAAALGVSAATAAPL